jgi:hypothetical protein
VLRGMEVNRDSAAGTEARRACAQREFNETASGTGMSASAAWAAGRSSHLA